MNQHISTLKIALEDPILEDITCICPSEYSKLSKILGRLSRGSYVSEWRYISGEVRYEYHIHSNGISANLRKAFEAGVRGGNPLLTALYTKEELESLIQ